jgi:two-component system response regulator HydG
MQSEKMKLETEKIAGKRILLVDDERVVRESIRGVLTRHDHIVVEANNGAEAFTMFSQGQFDLVVTDSVMPFLNGEELAIRIRQLAPRQPILMLTAYDSKRSPRNPVNAVLQKPFDYARLQQELIKLF